MYSYLILLCSLSGSIFVFGKNVDYSILFDTIHIRVVVIKPSKTYYDY
jgi:hypothetical protein